MEKRTLDAVDFAERIARAMLKIRSSNVFFVIQQAYQDREYVSWEDAIDIMLGVLPSEEAERFRAENP